MDELFSLNCYQNFLTLSAIIFISQLNTSIALTFFKGLSREFLYEEGEKFSTQIILSLVKNTAYKRIKWHKEQEHYCILATATFNIYIDY